MALSHKDGVSESTRRRILDTAQDIGYESSAKRSSVQPSIVNIVLERLPTSPTSDPFNRPILLGLETAAREAGYRITLEFVEPDEEPETARWERDSIAGIIILGGGDLSPDWARAASASNVPVVVGDHSVPGLELPTVVFDNVTGAYSATQYLIELGHERIGFIQGPSKYWTLSERMAGHLLAIQQHGADSDPKLIPPRVSHGEQKGYGEMKSLLSLQDPPTAIFTVSDRTAVGAYRAITEQGFSIPDDFSIVGFDNTTEASSLNPTLTTIETPREVMGRMTFHRLLHLVTDGDLQDTMPLKWTIPTHLVERGSVRNLHA